MIDFINVCCAIVVKNSAFLVAQRKSIGARGECWEFPGGKVEQNESFPDCIKRELLEELGLEIEISKQLSPVEHRYSDIAIRLIPFIVTPKNEVLYMTDHLKTLWITKEKASSLNWSSADKKVLKQFIDNL